MIKPCKMNHITSKKLKILIINPNNPINLNPSTMKRDNTNISRLRNLVKIFL